MPTKNALRKEKFQEVRNELAHLKAEEGWRPYHGGTYEYSFQPTIIDDPALSSRLYGPQTKSVQWEPTKQK